MANRIDLDGRVAIVTGGAQGIGRAIAERFAQSGARVVLWDRDEALVRRAADEIGAGAQAMVCDMTRWPTVRDAAGRVAEAFGRIDVLVNNAGVSGPNATVADYAVEDWLGVIDLDLNGVFYGCKAVAPTMVAQNYGRIVNIASIAGKEGNPNASAYSAAKAGVIALTKSLGKELAGHNIAVNCVTPAAARTAIFDQMSQTHIDYMLSKIPRGRFVQVAEIAAMVAFLASAENSFTTGAVFDLSGGRATY